MSKRVGVKLDELTYKKFKIYLAERNKTVQEMLEMMIKMLLRNKEQ